MRINLKTILPLLAFSLLLTACAGQANAQASVTFQPVTTVTLGTSIESSGALVAGRVERLDFQVAAEQLRGFGGQVLPVYHFRVTPNPGRSEGAAWNVVPSTG